MTNETIKHQLNHRTIRAFKPTNLSAEQLNTLYSVASHTPTSMFMQQMSIMHITDPDKRAAIREISKQPYVGANGDLFMTFIVTNKYGSKRARMMAVYIPLIFSSKALMMQSWLPKT